MASYIKERTKNAQFIVISLRNNMVRCHTSEFFVVSSSHANRVPLKTVRARLTIGWRLQGKPYGTYNSYLLRLSKPPSSSPLYSDKPKKKNRKSSTNQQTTDEKRNGRESGLYHSPQLNPPSNHPTTPPPLFPFLLSLKTTQIKISSFPAITSE